MDKDRIIPIIVVLIILISSFTYYYYYNTKNDTPDETLNSSTVDVVFDRSKGGIWSIWDTGSFGYSETVETLRGYGCNVSQNTIPLVERVNHMQSEDVLVLPAVPMKISNYSDNEEQALLDFVSRGGNLIVIGEHDDAYGIASRQNELLKNFGIKIRSNILVNKETNIGSKHWVEFSSRKLDLRKAAVWGAGSLNLSDGAERLGYMNTTDNGTNGRNYTVVAGNDYGDGDVACIGDANVFWNGKFDWGISYGENKKFLINLIEYLTDKKLKKKVLKPEFNMFTKDNCELTLKNPNENEVSVDIKGGSIERVEGKRTSKEIVYSVNVNRDGHIRFSTGHSAPVYVHFLSPPDNKTLNKKVLFDLSHGPRSIKRSASGLYQLASSFRNKSIQVTASEDPDYSSYDAVIVSNPLEEYSEEDLDTISQESNKMILLGEDYYSLKNEDLGFYAYLVNGYQGWEANPSPINQLGMKRGVRFSWYSIVDKNGPSLNPEVSYDENHTLQLFESCSLVPDTSYDRKETRFGYYGEGLNWFNWEWEGHEFEQNEDDKDGPMIYAAWNSQTYVFADTSPFENQRFNDNAWLAEEISKWIK